MDNVLDKIKKHLKKQQEAKKYSQEKVRVHRNTCQRAGRRSRNSQETTLELSLLFSSKRETITKHDLSLQF